MPSGERNGPRDLVARSGRHLELATTVTAGEPGHAKVAPAHGDPLGRSRPDLHRDAARAGDVALHRTGHELALGGAVAYAQRARPAGRAGSGLRGGDAAGGEQYRTCRNDRDSLDQVVLPLGDGLRAWSAYLTRRRYARLTVPAPDPG